MSEKRRVVITGVGTISSLGKDFDTLTKSLFDNKSGVSYIPEWEEDGIGLHNLIGSKILDFDEKSIPRQIRRSMGRVAMLATHATQAAFDDCGLSKEEYQGPQTGIYYASCMGGIGTIDSYFKGVVKKNSLVAPAEATTFLKIMPHTCAANLALAFGLQGRPVASCTACAASTQSIGFAFEDIRDGKIEYAICGGAEELTPHVPAVFQVLSATATYTDGDPGSVPAPFDKSRDGIVVGEGAGTFFLETLDSALKRGANIYAEIKGFATNNDASHMTKAHPDGLKRVMKQAVESSGLDFSEIDYVNAHATATPRGDEAESIAVQELFPNAAVSSLKGHLGHLMGAAGVVESLGCLSILKNNAILPTKNLVELDPACGELDYVMGSPRPAVVSNILKNSFAFGGVNASLVFSRYGE